jgi:HEPN domain-containing protein
MGDAKDEWVRSWLIKAHADLRSARALVALSEPATDTAIYHCQQAAEKALKGYLAFRDQPLERTHDLARLVELATVLEPAFAPLETQADILNPYATAFRYPDTPGALSPSVAEVANAIEHAQVVYDFVRGQIPEVAPPGTNHAVAS